MSREESLVEVGEGLLKSPAGGCLPLAGVHEVAHWVGWQGHREFTPVDAVFLGGGGGESFHVAEGPGPGIRDRGPDLDLSPSLTAEPGGSQGLSGWTADLPPGGCGLHLGDQLCPPRTPAFFPPPPGGALTVQLGLPDPSSPPRTPETTTRTGLSYLFPLHPKLDQPGPAPARSSRKWISPPPSPPSEWGQPQASGGLP